MTGSNPLDRRDGLAGNDLLFRHGQCPFLPEHIPRPVYDRGQMGAFQMLETGEWTAGPDGVEGGIDAVKNADTKNTLRLMTWMSVLMYNNNLYISS